MKNHMRKFCALLAALVMTASGAALADAKIMVSGSGETQVSADTAR